MTPNRLVSAALAIAAGATIAFATLQYAKQADALPKSDIDQLLKL